MAELTDNLLSEIKEGVLTLTLNRQREGNALTHDMAERLLASLAKAEKDTLIRLVLLQGAGHSFCSGVSAEVLRQRRESHAPPSAGDDLRRLFNPLIRQIRRMEKPVVASVSGLAAGVGAGLCFACDIKVCSVTAKFVLSAAQLGLVPDAGIAHMLVRAMGLSLALEHAWTAKPFSARQAEHFGLVNAVVPSDELAKATHDAVQRILAAPPRAVALTKRVFERALVNDLDAQLDYEAHVQDALGKTADHREGLASILDGRPPRFTGG
ncbi:MAG: enoyl-CoA hydratase-related protein [Elusimicrobiota bacterium]